MRWRLPVLPDSKTGRKTLVLNNATMAVLNALPRDGAYVIPGLDPDQSRADLNAPWRTIRRHAGLNDVRLHDLRHTFASIGAIADLLKGYSSGDRGLAQAAMMRAPRWAAAFPPS